MNYIFNEGRKFVAISFGLWILFAILDLDILSYLAFFSLVAVTLLYLKRKRVKMNFQESSIYAPCEGTIKFIEKLPSCEYFEDGCTKIVVENSCFDYALLAAPIDSKIELIKKIEGSFLKASTSKAQMLNEKMIVSFENENSKIVCEHIVSTSFDGIHLHVKDDEELISTQEYGLMIHGQTIIYIDKNTKLNVRLNQKLRVKESVLN